MRQRKYFEGPKNRLQIALRDPDNQIAALWNEVIKTFNGKESNDYKELEEMRKKFPQYKISLPYVKKNKSKEEIFSEICEFYLKYYTKTFSL